MTKEFKVQDLLEVSEKITDLENVRYSIKKAVYLAELKIIEATEKNSKIKAEVTHEIFNNDTEKKYKNADQRKAAVNEILDGDSIYHEGQAIIKAGDKTLKTLELEGRVNLIALNTQRRLYDIIKIYLK